MSQNGAFCIVKMQIIQSKMSRLMPITLAVSELLIFACTTYIWLSLCQWFDAVRNSETFTLVRPD